MSNGHPSLEALNSDLALYMRLSGKTAQEVLEKKGRDLGIQLYRGFTDAKWGGSGAAPGIARLELRARTAAGIGTRVRPELLMRYRSGRAADRAVRAAGGRVPGGRRSLWQRIVGGEVALRQSGRGSLAASFLLFRRRSSQARGVTYQVNRISKRAGYVERGENYLRIVGLTPGLAEVDRRYGITAGAIAAVRADMAPYFLRKLRENRPQFRILK